MYITTILRSLYYYSAGISWSVLSYPSNNPILNSLNVASPSLTSEYWISTFKANEKPNFQGKFPYWAEYSSLSAYDDRGLLIPNTSVSSSQVGLGLVTIDLMANISYDSKGFSVIHRIYRPPGYKTPQIEKFKVFQNGIEQPLADTSTARKNGQILQPEMENALGKNRQTTITGIDLYKPSDRELPGLFSNYDAIYLVAGPKRINTGMTISGNLGPSKTWIKHVGFMTTDLYTTVTYDSIEIKWNQNYTIFIGSKTETFNDYDDKNPEHHFLFWSAETLFPTVVMRIIDISCSIGDCKYLPLRSNQYVDPLSCEFILGDIYPTILNYT